MSNGHQVNNNSSQPAETSASAPKSAAATIAAAVAAATAVAAAAPKTYQHQQQFTPKRAVATTTTKTRSNTRTRPIDEKYEITSLVVEKKFSQAKVSKEKGVAESTLRGWIAKYEQIKNEYLSKVQQQMKSSASSNPVSNSNNGNGNINANVNLNVNRNINANINVVPPTISHSQNNNNFQSLSPSILLTDGSTSSSQSSSSLSSMTNYSLPSMSNNNSDNKFTGVRNNINISCATSSTVPSQLYATPPSAIQQNVAATQVNINDLGMSDRSFTINNVLSRGSGTNNASTSSGTATTRHNLMLARSNQNISLNEEATNNYINIRQYYENTMAAQKNSCTTSTATNINNNNNNSLNEQMSKMSDFLTNIKQMQWASQYPTLLGSTTAQTMTSLCGATAATIPSQQATIPLTTAGVVSQTQLIIAARYLHLLLANSSAMQNSRITSTVSGPSPKDYQYINDNQQQTVLTATVPYSALPRFVNPQNIVENKQSKPSTSSTIDDYYFRETNKHLNSQITPSLAVAAPSTATASVPVNSRQIDHELNIIKHQHSSTINHYPQHQQQNEDRSSKSLLDQQQQQYWENMKRNLNLHQEFLSLAAPKLEPDYDDDDNESADDDVILKPLNLCSPKRRIDDTLENRETSQCKKAKLSPSISSAPLARISGRARIERKRNLDNVLEKLKMDNAITAVSTTDTSQSTTMTDEEGLNHGIKFFEWLNSRSTGIAACFSSEQRDVFKMVYQQVQCCYQSKMMMGTDSCQ